MSGDMAGAFSWPVILAGVLFGSIGLAAFIYGKKNAQWRPLVIGILLMVYPYVLRGTLMIYLVGIGLTASLFLFRE